MQSAPIDTSSVTDITVIHHNYSSLQWLLLALLRALVIELFHQLPTAELALEPCTKNNIVHPITVKILFSVQVSSTPILGGPAAEPQQQPVSQASIPQQPPQQLPQQVQQQPPQSAFSRFDSFGTQYDDGSASMQPQRVPSMSLGPAKSLGPARSIPEGAPVVFEGNIATGSHMACIEVLHRVYANSLGTLLPLHGGRLKTRDWLRLSD